MTALHQKNPNNFKMNWTLVAEVTPIGGLHDYDTTLK
jgi:hypothetical protein